jgi:hypothetical protein
MDKTLTKGDEFGGEVYSGTVYPRWGIVEIRRTRQVSTRKVFTWRTRGSVCTGFLPWPEWRRDGTPGRRRTELVDNGGGGGLAQERREWDGGGGFGAWALKVRSARRGAAPGTRGSHRQPVVPGATLTRR